MFRLVRPIIACCLLGTIVLNSFHCVAHRAPQTAGERRDTPNPDDSSHHCESGCLCRGVVSYAQVKLPSPCVNDFEMPAALDSLTWYGIEHAEAVPQVYRASRDGPPLARQTLRAQLQSFLL